MNTTDDYKDYLNYHEFYELFWDRISQDLISNMYIDDNEDFIREVTLSMFKEYEEDRLTVNLAARILENYIKAMFKNKPMTSNLVDNYYNSTEQF